MSKDIFGFFLMFKQTFVYTCYINDVSSLNFQDYFFCWDVPVMVAFLLFTGVVMFSRRSGVGELKKGTGVEGPDQITTYLQIHNPQFHTDAAPSENLNKGTAS